MTLILISIAPAIIWFFLFGLTFYKSLIDVAIIPKKRY